MGKFERDIILRLRRQYSDREAVNLLLKRISELEYEVGVLKSELAEKEFIEKKIEKLQKKVGEHYKVAQKWMELYLNLKKQAEE